jgi:hypothetical protein
MYAAYYYVSRNENHFMSKGSFEYVNITLMCLLQPYPTVFIIKH